MDENVFTVQGLARSRIEDFFLDLRVDPRGLFTRRARCP